MIIGACKCCNVVEIATKGKHEAGRITYSEVLAQNHHHVTNRGYDGKDIFVNIRFKSQFPDYIEGASNRMLIHLFAYNMTNIATLARTVPGCLHAPTPFRINKAPEGL